VNAIHLKPGREKSVIQGHPWIFSGALARVDGQPQPGETVSVQSSDGAFLAWAAYSPQSAIRARVWSDGEDEEVGPALFRRRFAAALRLRETAIPENETTAMRLVHGESDGLPGLVVDRYSDSLVMQVLSAGAEFWRETFADLLVELTGVRNIYERSDVDVRDLEGLSPRMGSLRGDAPVGPVVIEENGLKFYVDLHGGQKTGFYIDQRRNRQRLRAYAAGREVLNCFCYTGGFTAYALAGGAQRVLSIDSSAEALEMARNNLELNGLPQEGAEWLDADVFVALRKLRDQGRSFDLIVLDPPKFAPTAAQVERAARGYKDINLLAFKLLRPGGVLFTFSCSGGISADLFQKIVAGAAQDAHVDALILEHLSQGPDHPVALRFPEGTYLKGLVCARME
jgi:23S rRNA (cytosine1962-C5)-methyltransferase